MVYHRHIKYLMEFSCKTSLYVNFGNKQTCLKTFKFVCMCVYNSTKQTRKKFYESPLDSQDYRMKAQYQPSYNDHKTTVYKDYHKIFGNYFNLYNILNLSVCMSVCLSVCLS